MSKIKKLRQPLAIRTSSVIIDSTYQQLLDQITIELHTGLMRA